MAAISFGKVTVTEPGKPVPVTQHPLRAVAIHVFPLEANDGNLYPGDKSLNKETLAGCYHPGLIAGQPWSLQGPDAATTFDTSELFLDSDMAGSAALVFVVTGEEGVR